jgi:hypothetical protein
MFVWFPVSITAHVPLLLTFHCLPFRFALYVLPSDHASLSTVPSYAFIVAHVVPVSPVPVGSTSLSCFTDLVHGFLYSMYSYLSCTAV